MATKTILVLDFETTFWRQETLELTSIRHLRGLGYILRSDTCDYSKPRVSEYTRAIEKMLIDYPYKRKSPMGANRYNKPI